MGAIRGVIGAGESRDVGVYREGLKALALLKAVDYVAKIRDRDIELSFEALRSKHSETFAGVEKYFAARKVGLKNVDDRVIEKCLDLYQAYLRYLNLVDIVNLKIASGFSLSYSTIIDRELEHAKATLPGIFWLGIDKRLFLNALNLLLGFLLWQSPSTKQFALIKMFSPAYVFVKTCRRTDEANTFHFEVLKIIVPHLKRQFRGCGDLQLVLENLAMNLQADSAQEFVRHGPIESYLANFRSYNSWYFSFLQLYLREPGKSRKTSLLSSLRLFYQNEFKK